MAPAHVPGEQPPVQGQNVYTNPPYQNVYPVDQYDGQSWTSQLQHAALVPDNPPQPWHPNAYPTQQYSQISSPYATQGQTHRTASPYQYGQFANHNGSANYGHAANVDPSLGVNPTVMRQQQQSPYQLAAQAASPQSRSNTVTPQSLQHSLPVQVQDPHAAASYQIPKPSADTFAQRAVNTPFTQPIPVPEYDIPKSKTSGGFYVVDQAALIKATKSAALNKFVTFGTEPFHLPSNRTALPQYIPRQSVKDLKKLGADSKKLARKAPTKQLSAGRVLKREISDSESDYDSSDEESDYSSDEEEEISPLPKTKPEEPKEAFRYDVIKASWHPRRSHPSEEKIKDSLTQLWEVLKTIHNRWRMDSKALTEAEAQKKLGELPVLKRRVAEQRDLLQSTLKSSLEFSHPDVLYQLAKVKSFLYLCYQFLANRIKVLDYDGELPSAIIQVLAQCAGTATTEVLEETKLMRALNMLKKKVVNDKTKALIQKIEDDAAAGSKKAKVGSPQIDVTAEAKPAKRPAPQPGGRASTEGPAKKLKAEPTTNGDKKLSTTTGTSKTVPAAQQKKPSEKPVPAPVRARGIQITNKPSSLFASLNAGGKKSTGPATSAPTAKLATKPSVPNSTAKKPATAPPAAKPLFSFAETMKELLKPKEEKVTAPSKTEKQLPPETPEEKAKRLRKESRRHLRVKFRPGDALVSIKYFHHDPEEESGHDENFVRDAGDVGGEGRMFKQHKEMDDEDEEEEKEMDYSPWKDVSAIDFSTVPEDERKRNYTPYGGGEAQPTSPERDAALAYENKEVMVYYARPADIPPSPREPPVQETETVHTSVLTFGEPSELVLSRVSRPSTSAPPAPTVSPVPPTDSNINLASILQQIQGGNQATYPSTQTPIAPAAPAAPTATPDIQAILASLNQAQGQTQNSIQAPMAIPPVLPAAAPMDMNQIMAMAHQLAQPGNAAFPAPPPFPLPNWSGYPPVPQQQQQPDMASMYPNQNSQQHAQHNGYGKRQYQDDGAEPHGGGKRNKHERGPYKVIPCKFYAEGKCNKGARCTFIHPQE